MGLTLPDGAGHADPAGIPNGRARDEYRSEALCRAVPAAWKATGTRRLDNNAEHPPTRFGGLTPRDQSAPIPTSLVSGMTGAAPGKTRPLKAW